MSMHAAPARAGTVSRALARDKLGQVTRRHGSPVRRVELPDRLDRNVVDREAVGELDQAVDVPCVTPAVVGPGP